MIVTRSAPFNSSMTRPASLLSSSGWSTCASTLRSSIIRLSNMPYVTSVISTVVSATAAVSIRMKYARIRRFMNAFPF